jgi:transcriptional regulator GlxA family with amidase domain
MSLHIENAAVGSSANVTTMLVHIQDMSTENAASARHWADKLATLMRDAEQAPSKTPHPAMGGLAPWQIRRLRQYVATQIESTMRVEAAASLIGLSRSHFSRCFKASFGESFGSYVQRKRIGHAQQMMLSTREALSHIAAACGFADQAHFTRSFGRHVGQTPHAWRRNAANLAKG